MKLAVPAQGEGFHARLDSRFGRCATFVLVDTESGAVRATRNPAATASGGAGVKAAAYLVGLGLDGVIAREVGPHAAQVFNAAGVTIHSARGETVAEALAALGTEPGRS